MDISQVRLWCNICHLKVGIIVISFSLLNGLSAVTLSGRITQVLY